MQLSPVTGDLGGLEVEFHPEARQPYALVVFCEGWCNQAHRVPVKLSGKSFSLTFAEPLFDASGAQIAEDHYQVEGRLVGRTLVVDLQLNATRWKVKLQRFQSRLGLDVARPPAERVRP